jgi:hypothetical protein
MTTDREIERILDRWLADGPSNAPDRVVDDLADRIARVGQRPALRLDRRPYPMNLPLKLAWLAAAVVVVAVAGYALLPRPAVNVGGPSPTPPVSPSPSPTPTAAATAFVCDDGGTTTCAGDLTAGANTSRTFSPAISFTVPAGWRNTFDIARTYTLRPPGGTYSFLVYSQNAIPEQNDTCTPAKKAGAADTVDAWVAYLTTHPGLVASAPQPVTIGGHAGQMVTFQRAASWTRTCPNSIGPAIVTITDSGATPARVKFVDDQVESFLIVDVDGRTVIVEISSAPSAVAHEADMQAARTIVDSIRFTPPPSASPGPTP